MKEGHLLQVEVIYLYFLHGFYLGELRRVYSAAFAVAVENMEVGPQTVWLVKKMEEMFLGIFFLSMIFS